MPKVIHIRNVPDQVHDSLVSAADAQGLSLTRFVQRELEHIARRSQIVHENAAVVRGVQAHVNGRAGRDAILSVLREGREDHEG